MANFGEKLRKLRTNAKLTQMKLAKKIGIGYKTIYAYESGKVTPSIDVAARLAKFFQVSADYFLFDDQEQEERVRDREMLDYLVKADQLHHFYKSILKEIIDSLLAKQAMDQKAPAQIDTQPRSRTRRVA